MSPFLLHIAPSFTLCICTHSCICIRFNPTSSLPSSFVSALRIFFLPHHPPSFILCFCTPVIVFFSPHLTPSFILCFRTHSCICVPSYHSFSLPPSRATCRSHSHYLTCLSLSYTLLPFPGSPLLAGWRTVFSTCVLVR